MKKWKFLLMAGVVGASVCVSAVGCGGGSGGDEKLDNTKTQLYISNFDAGIGRTWVERLGAYDAVRFHRGQGSPVTMLVECLGISVGKGRPEWGAPEDKEVFIIKLGKRL